MGKKSISKNYIYNLFYQILAIVMPIITTPYLSRVLGAEAIGIYSYTLSVATYFVLAGTLGINIYAQREIAYVQEDKKKRSIVFWEIIIVKFISMAISMLLFELTFARTGDYKVYFRILTIELISQGIDISWFFQGMEEFRKTVIRNSLVKLLFSISIFIFIKSPEDLPKYIILITLANLLGNLSLWLYVPKYVSKVKIKSLNIIQHLKPTMVLFIPQVASQIYSVIDRTMLGEMVANKAEVGFYEQAQKVVRILLTIVTSLGTVMVPRMANVFAKGDNDQLKKYMQNSFYFVFLLAFPIMGGLVLIAPQFVPIFFGEGYDRVVILSNIILPIILFIGISNVIGTQFLLPTKKQKEYTISVIVGAVFNCILNFILIKKFQAIGASIATVMAEALVAIVQLYYVRSFINIKTILKLSRNYIISAIVMFVVVYFTEKAININGVFLMAIKAVEGFAIYIIMLLILKDHFLIQLKDRIFKNKAIL